ncbi:aspartate-semialdehyde dehydrogenase [Gracilibacillus ureilyticus]|uniref:Aspartate-semialdehyde dehydrogenase n=1 Tax=Gracilibacillus ureilyticus TaxID=531814 RepID=A0A1H9L951_9BACI|nr:aspartate-semialdehyde dehydrogenase [Gracilibacillus ureilyticus]SER07828.1 aspartate-semialdehyde dehydrogenase [Gracilibacillus ureilyticus]
MTTQGYNVAVVGATGAVGEKMLETLEKKNFPINELHLLSSKRSAGKEINFKGVTYTVKEATPESFENIQIALFSAGGSVSKALAHEAVKRGAVVVDNTSAFRMDPDVPLVVPEVNEEDIAEHNGIIANPNCSTIQMVAALKPIQDQFGLSRVIVSTYQAVSGAGTKAVNELEAQSQAFLEGKELEPEILPVSGEKQHYPIAFNALPQIDVFQENGYTFEEMKMINETKKIMHDSEIKVAATCVRLPFFTSHAESVYVEVDKDNISVEQVQEVIKNADGVVLEDDVTNQVYPTPLSAAGKPDVFVGRVRKDLDNSKGFHLWVVSDNLLKGAAWNSVQIAESLIKNNWLQK